MGSYENHPFEYKHLPWGELIYGSKDELQGLGIAIDRAFPGEPGGPRRELNVADPRGYPCSISRWGDSDTFSASIDLPGRERDVPAWEISDWQAFAPGVKMRRTLWWGDEFVGTDAALVAAGLVVAGLFPGMPGMPKTIVSIAPDGDLRRYRNSLGARLPGAKQVTRRNAREYLVTVHIDADEARERWELWRQTDDAWEARMLLLPRPSPLVNAGREVAAKRRRAEMKLVWSRPAYVPELVL